MATAGRIPTTTVCASSMRDMAAILPSMRPMNESTISSDEISTSTPRAPVSTIRERQVVLQLHRQLIVHVHLDRDQQVRAHLENRNAFHVPQPVDGSHRLRCRGDVTPAVASARREGIGERRLRGDVLRSTPRWTMVCAICGRMPLMMQSAPIRRAAATVFSRCCATSVSTVGTPVMSIMAIGDAGLDDALQQALHHDLRAGAVERADQRQREDAVPQLDDRRRKLQQLLLLTINDALAGLLVISVVYSPSESRRTDALHVSSASAPASVTLFRSCVKIGRFNEKTNIAVSPGVNPCIARESEMRASSSSTGRQVAA